MRAHVLPIYFQVKSLNYSALLIIFMQEHKKIRIEKQIKKVSATQRRKQGVVSRLSEQMECEQGSEIIMRNVACKKEIKHFLNCVAESFHQNSLRECLLTVSHLFMRTDKSNKSKLLQSCSLIQQSTMTANRSNRIVSILNKIKPSHICVIVFISFRLCKQKREFISFDVQALSFEGKIIYKKANLKNWQDINSELEKLKANFCKIIPFISNKSQLIDYTQQQIELRDFLGPFNDLHTFSPLHSLCVIERGLCDKQQIITSKAVSSQIEKYKYIIEWLHNSINKSPLQLNINQLLTITLAYNIIVCFNISIDQPVETQIDPYIDIIVGALSKEFQIYQNQRKQENNTSHYPGKLPNAHNCRICGPQARTYICCPTCRKTQKRQVPLCLKCYEPYHQQLKLFRESSLEQLQKWDSMNTEVENLLAMGTIKKEQQ